MVWTTGNGQHNYRHDELRTMIDLTRDEVREQREFEVVIDDFGFKGEGYVRLADGWLSVPGALPGEKVRVRVEPGQPPRSRRVFAQVEEVLDASSQRQDPRCERDAICRGCQLRHLTVAAELEFKVRTVREVIERYAGLDEGEQPDIEVVTPQPIARGDSFRIRSRLTYQRRGDEFELGLRTPVREGLITMHDCPALTRPVQRLVATVTESLESLQTLPVDEVMVEEAGDDALGVRQIAVAAPFYGVGLIDVELTEAEDEEHFESFIERGVVAQWLEKLAQALPEKVGVAVHSGSFRRHIGGPQRIRIPIDKWQMEVGFDDWFHATLEPAEVVYAKTLEWLDLGREDRLLDLGCGTGTISLMTSEEVEEVVGLDANPASIEAAELNAVAHGRENVRFVVGGWEKAVRELAMDGVRFTVATINPMREPLGHRPLAFLEILGVERLVYLGPSPEAASKDIGLLREMGWKIRRLGAGNLHPATYHTMLMAYLERSGDTDGGDE
jgi:23S rRNA (uracil1939-C5)-methyltransferase